MPGRCSPHITVAREVGTPKIRKGAMTQICAQPPIDAARRLLRRFLARQHLKSIALQRFLEGASLRLTWIDIDASIHVGFGSTGPLRGELARIKRSIGGLEPRRRISARQYAPYRRKKSTAITRRCLILLPPSSKSGGGGLSETRTRDQRIKSPLLYRLSYQPDRSQKLWRIFLNLSKSLAWTALTGPLTPVQHPFEPPMKNGRTRRPFLGADEPGITRQPPRRPCTWSR